MIYLGTADYKNEAEVGEALSEAFKEGLVKREDLFVTTKVPPAPSFYLSFNLKRGEMRKLLSSDLSLFFFCLQLWNSDHGHVVEACKDSLKKLQLDYLDLYLVHFPVATRHTGYNISSS